MEYRRGFFGGLSTEHRSEAGVRYLGTVGTLEMDFKVPLANPAAMIQPLQNSSLISSRSRSRDNVFEICMGSHAPDVRTGERHS